MELGFGIEVKVKRLVYNTTYATKGERGQKMCVMISRTPRHSLPSYNRPWQRRRVGEHLPSVHMSHKSVVITIGIPLACISMAYFILFPFPLPQKALKSPLTSAP